MYVLVNRNNHLLIAKKLIHHLSFSRMAKFVAQWIHSAFRSCEVSWLMKDFCFKNVLSFKRPKQKLNFKLDNLWAVKYSFVNSWVNFQFWGLWSLRKSQKKSCWGKLDPNSASTALDVTLREGWVGVPTSEPPWYPPQRQRGSRSRGSESLWLHWCRSFPSRLESSWISRVSLRKIKCKAVNELYFQK